MAAQRRTTRLLLGATVSLGIAYAGWGFADRALNDPPAILDPASQVGYCIAGKLTATEKKVVAESLMRPADSALVGRLMPLIHLLRLQWWRQPNTGAF